MPSDRVFFIGMIVFSGLVFLNMVRIQVGLHAGGAGGGKLAGYAASPRVREMVAEAKIIQQRHGFVLFMEFSAGYAQMAQSWLCNTRGMESVHGATLMSTDDEGFRQMRSFIANHISPTAADRLPTVVRNPLPERYQGSWRYGSWATGPMCSTGTL